MIVDMLIALFLWLFVPAPHSADVGPCTLEFLRGVLSLPDTTAQERLALTNPVCRGRVVTFQGRVNEVELAENGIVLEDPAGIRFAYSLRDQNRCGPLEAIEEGSEKRLTGTIAYALVSIRKYRLKESDCLEPDF